MTSIVSEITKVKSQLNLNYYTNR